MADMRDKDPRHTEEKFAVAVSLLATGKGRINERILDAFIEQLHAARPADGLSKETNRRIEQLHAKLNRVEAKGNEGTTKATITAMSEDEAAEVAWEIDSLNGRIRREIEETEAARKR
jgi:hypothetical protein